MSSDRSRSSNRASRPRSYTGDRVAAEVYALTVVEFRDPRVIRIPRRCGRCNDYVLVYVMDDAFCPREPHYRCCDCVDAPEGLGRVLSLVEAEGRPQLHLEEGGTS